MAAIIVTDSGDSGPGTLRDAIANAKAGDTITFDPGLAGRKIILGSTLSITKPVTIDGAGANITVSGANLVTDFNVDFTAAGTATLKGLTIADGHGTGTTGSAGPSAVDAAAAMGGPGGDAAGGVFVKAGSIDLSNDHFVNDSATGGTGGMGGVFSASIGGFSINLGAMGGTGGNAAGGVYVEPEVAVIRASDLVFDGDSAAGGAGGAGGMFAFETGPVGTSGTGYQDVNPAVCFASGTLVRTAQGDVPVEHLAVGDQVVTASGSQRSIRWLGHRTIDCRRHPRPQEAWPVRIVAHAFGESRPARDLYVSPGHSICVEILGGEVLVPAAVLMNGTSVAPVAVETVTYWHVELDTHDILLAENLPAESYFEMGNRDFFAGASVVALGGVPDAPVATHADFCRPYHDAGPLVAAVRARLAVRREKRDVAKQADAIASDIAQRPG